MQKKQLIILFFLIIFAAGLFTFIKYKNSQKKIEAMCSSFASLYFDVLKNSYNPNETISYNASITNKTDSNLTINLILNLYKNGSLSKTEKKGNIIINKGKTIINVEEMFNLPVSIPNNLKSSENWEIELIIKNKKCVFKAKDNFLALSKNAEQNKPWITISPNKRYFMFENGGSFFPIGVSQGGENINTDYINEVKFDKWNFSVPKDMERFMAEMQKNGENTLRIDIEGWGYFPEEMIDYLIQENKIGFLENPVGNFNESYAKRVDYLFTLAEKYNIYFDLVMTLHSCQWATYFNKYPYHISKGGPWKIPFDMITDEHGKELWKNRLKYMADRWGKSDRIFTWELNNEITECFLSPGPDVPLEPIKKWVEEMGEYLKNYEKQKYGKSHLISVSAGDYLFNNSGTDIAVTHFYTPSTYKLDPISSSLEIRGRTDSHLLNIVNYKRPYIENERQAGSFIFANWFFPPFLHKSVEHNIGWTLMANGAAGAGLPWAYPNLYTNLYNDPPGHRHNFVKESNKAMSNFVKNVDFANFNSRNINKDISSSIKEITPSASGDGKTVIGWLLHDTTDDYKIDYINIAKNSDIFSKQSLEWIIPLQYWYNFLTDDNIPFDLTPYSDKLAEFLVKKYNISRPDALKYINQMFTDPESFQRDYSRYLDEESVSQILGIINKIYRYFDSLEKEKQTLAKKYTNYKEVSADIFINNLCAGEHTITWYDDKTGLAIKSEGTAGKNIKIKTPNFNKSIAFIIKSPQECK